MFRFIEHTADMGLEAVADSWAAVFEEMGAGLKSMIFGTSPVEVEFSKDISVHADDPVELLVGWLNELVYRCEAEELVPAEFRVHTIDENKLHATVTGESFDPGRHVVERQVKSVTYHQACLEEKAEGWYARVYVDL